MQTPEAFAALKRHFGSHSSAALALGLTPEHYRAIRNARVSAPDRTMNLIKLKAIEVSLLPDISAQPSENISGEA